MAWSNWDGSEQWWSTGSPAAPRRNPFCAVQCDACLAIFVFLVRAISNCCAIVHWISSKPRALSILCMPYAELMVCPIKVYPFHHYSNLCIYALFCRVLGNIMNRTFLAKNAVGATFLAFCNYGFNGMMFMPSESSICDAKTASTSPAAGWYKCVWKATQFLLQLGKQEGDRTKAESSFFWQPFPSPADQPLTPKWGFLPMAEAPHVLFVSRF